MKKFSSILFLFISLSCIAQQGHYISGNVISNITLYARPIDSSIELGDSFMADYLETSWNTQLESDFSFAAVRLAVSGTGATKQINQYVTHAHVKDTFPLLTGYGFNDVRVLTGAQVRYNHITSAHRAMCAIHFTKSIIFPFGSTDGSHQMTFTDGGAGATSEDTLINWSSRTYYYRHYDASNSAANWFNRTVSVNETISCTTASGTAIAVGTFACDGSYLQMSRIKVTVDGVDKTTYDPNGLTLHGENEGFRDAAIPDAIVITGLSNATHSVTITFLDNKRGALDYIAVLQTPGEANKIPVYILDMPHMNSTGYAYPGGETTQAILDSCTSYRNGVLQTSFPGYPLVFVNDNSPVGTYDPSDAAQINSDGIHPTTLGGTHIKNDVKRHMQ